MRVGVLGGGLSGLVVGGYTHHDFEVLEAGDRLGGHCQSLVEKGYTFDLGGPHILFSKNTEILAEIHNRLGNNLTLKRRDNRICYKGRLVKYPFENGLYDLDPQDRFECLYSYLHNNYPAPKNFKEWMYHVFGQGIAEKYMIPYNEKIWNIPSEQLAFDWVDGRVPRPPEEDVVKSAVGVITEGYTHQLTFGYPKSGGIEALPRAYADLCPRLTLNFKVARVWKDGNEWFVSDGRQTKVYDQLVSTIPIQDLVDALPDVPGDVHQAVHGLRYNSLTVVMLGARCRHPLPYTALYVPDPAIVFHRLSFPLNFTDEGAPPEHMAVAAEITTNPGDGVHELDDHQMSLRVINELDTMGIIHHNDVTFARCYRTKQAYVVRTFDYKKKLASALSYLNSLGIVSVGRNAEFEYINMDEAIRRGHLVGRLLEKRVTADYSDSLELENQNV
jgi:protoporphyrinogen oxidase